MSKFQRVARNVLGTCALTIAFVVAIYFSSRTRSQGLQAGIPVQTKIRISSLHQKTMHEIARPGVRTRVAPSPRFEPWLRRRRVFMRAEEVPTIEKIEEKEELENKSQSGDTSPTPEASASSNTNTMSALEGMLGGADAAGQVKGDPVESAHKSEAQGALDVLSGWFGPSDVEIEREKQKEERLAEEKKRKEAENGDSKGMAVIVESSDERMSEDVMQALGLGKGANATDGMRSEMAEMLLDDLKERAKTGDEKDKELLDAVTSFLDTAQKYQAENISENALRNDFVNLLDKLQPENRVDSEEMKRIQKEVLGPKTFFVTSADSAAKFDGVFGLRDTGYVFCGNFRGEQREVFQQIEKKVKDMFGDKYEILLIPDPELEVDPFYDNADPAFTKAALQIVPYDRAQPAPEAPWAVIASVILFGLTAFGAVQLGAQAASVQLPAETIKWLSNPENFKTYDPSVVPPGIANWDPTIFLTSTGQIAGGAMGVQIIHEIGHRISAYLRNVKLGMSTFLPMGNLPTSFGAITPIKSLVKTNEDLFDIAAAGPLSGLILASILFAAGLALTGQTPQSELVAVPYPFVQQSLLLGTIVKAALGIGDGALVSDALLVHPLVVAGWVGLVAQAFNSLPVGAIDGGRMVQATFGNGPLGFTSLITYGALGFGLLGGPVDGLFFGLYLLFLQRNPEKFIQDTVTLADDNTRRATALALVIFSALVLTPLGS